MIITKDTKFMDVEDEIKKTKMEITVMTKEALKKAYEDGNSAMVAAIAEILQSEPVRDAMAKPRI